MDSIELLKCLEKIVGKKKYDYGVISSDMLENKLEKKTPKALICNLQSSFFNGNHWIVIFSKDGIKYQVFDSFGDSVLKFGKYFVKLSKLCPQENLKVLQNAKSISCALFCLYVIYHLLKGTKFQMILNKLKKSKYNNEIIVNCFYRKIFKKKPPINDNFEWNMCCVNKMK